MNTKAWILISAILVISCAGDDSDPAVTPAFEATIDTFAGTTFGHEGDGGPAKFAKLGYITGLARDVDGNMFVSDGAANVIRKVNTSFEMSTIAGKFLGWNVIDPDQYSGDGGPATSAHLNVPLWVTVDLKGNVFISDAGNNVLRKINSSGVITTIAGKFEQGHTGDNGPANQALINGPSGLATDAAGNLYFADSQNHVIRKISVTGEITTIAGTPGEAGFSGDGGPATAAKLSGPNGVAIDKNGVVYITDNNSVIRRIGDGRITTIAGSGVEGYSGDGGKATAATMLSPKGIVVTKDGSIVFADAGNNRIRRIIPEAGIIETIAGTGVAGYSGDGGPAHLATISNPQGLTIDWEGNIYIAEAGNSVIRVIRPLK
jgi:sugar lactone lactonase YvrE